jgi:hypothetical protein
MHEHLECEDALAALGEVRLDVLVGDIDAKTSHRCFARLIKHVEAALAAVCAQRTEAHWHPAAEDVGTVANRYEDDVALVTLHVFQVLHEEGLGRVGLEEILGISGGSARRITSSSIHWIARRCAAREGGDPERQARVRTCAWSDDLACATTLASVALVPGAAGSPIDAVQARAW